MSKRTLVGSFDAIMYATGRIGYAEHEVFAYESPDQTKSWRIKEIDCWLNPLVDSGGDSRALLSYCLTTDFLTPPADTTTTGLRVYAEQFNASDNRGIAWGMMDYQNRDATTADFRVPSFEFKAIADGRRAINYLILNTLTATEGSAILATGAGKNTINYRIVMEEIKVTPAESILHQVRGLAQDTS